MGRVNAQSTSSTQRVSPTTSESSFKIDWDPNVKGGVVITKFTGSERDISIPARINNYPVTGIGEWTFNDCTSLTSVIIPGSVTSIGDYAFSGCTSLTSVTIPNSVTSIGGSAFRVCKSLTSVTIPNSVTSIGERAFVDCTSLTAINVVADNRAFSAQDGILYNKNKTVLHTYPAGKKGSFTIPNSVTSIGEWAFSSCTSLTSVTIPNSVTSIGSAFGGCTSLTAINVIADNRAFSAQDGILYNKDKTVLHTYPAGKKGSFTIPNSVTSIEEWAFSSCTSLTSVTIPNSVTSIGSAFGGCTSLTSVTIPASVTSIGAWAFAICTSLTNVTFATGSNISYTDFGSYAFPEGGSGEGGDSLKNAYSTGKAGTYKRAVNGSTWTKQ
ncbi:MAG: leucine-rich repeat domain-containing protein [Treponema sp.]|nr:leucine-rich repeat domain-containing protein [Treponema sp.]